MGVDRPVLILDSDAEVAAATARELDNEGYETDVLTGTDVTAAEVGDDVACVITEAVFPETDGIELAQRLRFDRPSLPIVIYTDSGSERVASRALSAGVDEYVRKSDGTGALVTALEWLLKHAAPGTTIARDPLEGFMLASQMGIVVLASDGVIVAANDRAAALFERGRHEIESRHYDDPAWRLTDVDGERLAEDDLPHRRVLNGETSVTNLRHGLELADGRRKYLSVNAMGVRDGPGDVVCSIADITAQVERERQLERYRTIVETSGDIIYAHDAEGTITLANHTFGEYMMSARDELIGTHIGDVLPEGAYGTETKLIEALRQTDKTDRGRYEFELEHSTVGHRYLEGNISLLYDERGQFDGAVGVVRDITDRKNQAEELERRNASLDEFASIVGHDVRNPLNVIIGRAQLLRETEDVSHLEAIEANAKRIDELLTDLLTLARQGKAIEDPSPLSLRNVVTAAWGTVETGEATLEVSDELGSVLADRGRLHQLLENLIRNAIEHGGESVTVRIEPTTDGFAFADDGVGIGPEMVDQIFEHGFTTNRRGTGLGLSIVSRIAEAHGWNVTLDENYEEGTRFCIHTHEE